MLPGSILLKLSCQHDKAWAYPTALTRATHLPTLVPLPPTPNTKIPPTFVPPPHTPHGSPSPDATQCQVCQTPFIEKKMLLCDQANIYSLQAPWTRVLDHSVILSPDGLLWFDYVYHVAGSTGSRLKQISVHCKPLGPGSFTTLGWIFFQMGNWYSPSLVANGLLVQLRCRKSKKKKHEKHRKISAGLVVTMWHAAARG